MNIDRFNTLEEKEALELLNRCGQSTLWSKNLLALRPYGSFDELRTNAAAEWQALSDAEQHKALALHPLIGDVEMLKEKFSGGKENRLAKSEQGQGLSSSEAVIEELARQNKAYYQRHGFIFIVYAKGKSADEMLQILNIRMNNTTADEFANAAAEHQRITQSRLQDIFDESGSSCLNR